MKWFIALSLSLCSSGALADVLGLIDYDALFAAHADEITRDEGGFERLVIGEVLLTRYPNQVVSTDLSQHGAIGCFTGLFGIADATVRMCPDLVNPAEQDQLDSIREKLLAFYEHNVGRPVTAQQVRDGYESRALIRHPDACSDPDILMFIDHFAREPKTIDTIDQLFDQPRLPAGNPCL